MNVKMDLFDLLGLYTKAGASMAGALSRSFVQSFHKYFTIDDALKYSYFRDKGIGHAKSRRYRQAVAILRQLNQLDPVDADVALYLGISLLKVGDKEEGMALLETSFKAYPDNNRIRTILSIAYMQREAYDKAIPLLEAIANEEPENIKAQLGLGEAYQKAGEHTLAIEVLLALSEHLPEDTKVLRTLGFAYEAGGYETEASAMFKRVAELEA